MNDLIERMRLLELDHEPDGWPAVQMRDITALLDALEAYRKRRGVNSTHTLGEPVAMIRHFHYEGIARNGTSQEAVMLDGAPMLPEGTQLYATPQQERKPLTESAIQQIGLAMPAMLHPGWLIEFARAIERAHGITAGLRPAVERVSIGSVLQDLGQDQARGYGSIRAHCRQRGVPGQGCGRAPSLRGHGLGVHAVCQESPRPSSAGAAGASRENRAVVYGCGAALGVAGQASIRVLTSFACPSATCASSAYRFVHCSNTTVAAVAY